VEHIEGLRVKPYE